MRSVNKIVNPVNMALLQDQIDFTQKEHDRCKLVYDFLLKEYGEKQILSLDKEVTEQILYFQSIICSLEELKTIKSQTNGNEG